MIAELSAKGLSHPGQSHFSRVSALVLDEVRALDEALAALEALVSNAPAPLVHKTMTQQEMC